MQKLSWKEGKKNTKRFLGFASNSQIVVEKKLKSKTLPNLAECGQQGQSWGTDWD